MLYFIAAAVLLFIVGVFLAFSRFQPTRNVDRGKFSHWLKSLMRLYCPGASLRFQALGSPVELTVILADAQEVGCQLLLPLVRASWSEACVDGIRHAVMLDEKVSVVADAPEESPSALFGVRVTVPDIWNREAPDVMARVLHRVLDTLGIGSEARFDLVFQGKRSLEQTKQAHRRLKEGLEW